MMYPQPSRKARITATCEGSYALMNRWFTQARDMEGCVPVKEAQQPKARDELGKSETGNKLKRLKGAQFSKSCCGAVLTDEH